MKKNNFIKRVLVALTLAVAVAVMVPAAGSVEAQAAPKKITGNKNWKKAPSVKQNKTYKVTSKSKTGTYVKFTAKKAGKYVVTVSNFRTLGISSSAVDHNLANVYIRKPSASGSYLSRVKVKTQGGKTDWICMATPDSYNAYYKGVKAKVTTYLAKRTATFSLKAGETIYVNMGYYTGNKCKCTYDLKIKRK